MKFGKRAASRAGKIVLGLALLLAALAGGIGTASAHGDHSAGAVYVLTNAADRNEVAVFERRADGRLKEAGRVATGGKGTGAGLGSQGALALSANRRWLFAVNAGSNEISVFKARNGDLRLVDKVASGGEMPVSLTVHDDLLYVLNAGDSGSITGFTIDDGRLSPLPGSTRPLSNGGSGPAPGPAQVQFSHDGDLLVVTEKATNLIDVYTIGDGGIAEGPQTHASAGQTPFGFAFDRRERLIVSEAFGGAPGKSALSSYDTDDDGSLDVISASAPTHQTAACWVTVTRDGRYAYTTNAGSDNISGYRISRAGRLSLIGDGKTGATGSKPTDLDLSRNSRYLYALNSGAGSISAFRVEHDGSLKPLGTTGALPAGAVGLAAN